LLLADEAHDRLGDEVRRAERVPWLLSPHVAVGEAMDLLVDERQELLQGRGVPRAPPAKEDGDVFWRRPHDTMIEARWILCQATSGRASVSVITLRRGRRRQLHLEHRAPRIVPVDGDPSAVALHDAPHDAEAEPGPRPVRLRGEERIEDPLAV